MTLRARTAHLPLLCVAAASVVAFIAPPATASAHRPAVVDRTVIGHSVHGRDIVAWQLGNPKAKRTVVVMAAIHGDETAPRRIVRSLRDGAKIRGINLWVIPTTNPDGVANDSRRNAHGVDLNRNFPVKWKKMAYGPTYAGSKPKSEPETRALIRFYKLVKPDKVVSFHQPLYGVDTSGRHGAFARKLARYLKLPRKSLDCGSGCHGTMSQWFNKRLDGALVTVELGSHPSHHYLTRTAPHGLLRAVGGKR